MCPTLRRRVRSGFLWAVTTPKRKSITRWRSCPGSSASWLRCRLMTKNSRRSKHHRDRGRRLAQDEEGGLARSYLNLCQFTGDFHIIVGSGSVSTKMSDKLQFVVAPRQAKAYRTSN